jgi:hypothetical protein
VTPFLAVLVLACLPASGRPEEPDPVLPRPGPELEVRSGRVQVLEDARTALLTPAAPARVLDGPTLVEVGTRSQAVLRWGGSGSLRIDGRAALHVDREEATAGHPARARVAFDFLRSAEVELRRGALLLDLPRGFSLELDRAVVALRELADGRVEVVHRGGRPVRILRPAHGVGDEAERPSLLLAPGRSVLLGWRG